MDILEKIDFKGVFLGLVALTLFFYVLGKIFAKSPREIAEEGCIDMVETAEFIAFGQVNSSAMTINIEGKSYRCSEFGL